MWIETFLSVVDSIFNGTTRMHAHIYENIVQIKLGYVNNCGDMMYANAPLTCTQPWDTLLQCDAVSDWLGTNLESALYFMWNCLQTNVTGPYWWYPCNGWQRAITGVSVCPDLCHHMASLGHNDLNGNSTKPGPSRSSLRLDKPWPVFVSLVYVVGFINYLVITANRSFCSATSNVLKPPSIYWGFCPVNTKYCCLK